MGPLGGVGKVGCAAVFYVGSEKEEESMGIKNLSLSKHNTVTRRGGVIYL